MMKCSPLLLKVSILLSLLDRHFDKRMILSCVFLFRISDESPFTTSTKKKHKKVSQG